MSRAEREAFLQETRVGILSIAEPGRGPLAVPVWYAFSPGGTLRLVISSASRKAELIRAAGRASLCVQADIPPYRYVSVEGRTSLGEPDFERDERAMAHRYLGLQLGERYLAATAAERAAVPNLLVLLQPERWLSVDYGKMGF
jgi:nitroimidazol reductase NimA-like FMN-containing flavoprotein (pyridoxamine 5'-phosphate oxidase superfamily)